MNILMGLLTNFPLMCALSAWLTAQLIKFFIALFSSHGKADFNKLWQSGGMPSSHSASTCALVVALIIKEGAGSPCVAIAAMLSFIATYDALNVRRTAGDQGKLLNRLVAELHEKKHIDFKVTLREVCGHTMPQVVAGNLLGLAVPLIAHLVFGW